jgi:hypothetical protein
VLCEPPRRFFGKVAPPFWSGRVIFAVTFCDFYNFFDDVSNQFAMGQP